MLKHLTIGLSLLLVTPSVLADEYNDAVNEFLDVSNTLRPAVERMNRMLDQLTPGLIGQLESGFKRQGKTISEKEIIAFVDAYKSRTVERLQKEMKPLMAEEYRKFLSLDDVRSLTELMRSPVYQRYAEKLPELSASSQAAGEKLGRKVGQDVMEQLLKENPRFQ